MSEGILLPMVEHGRLLPLPERVFRLSEAIPQIEAALAQEQDSIIVQSTLSCLLWETLTQTNWCGFYRRLSATELGVGPYQGTMGCLRINIHRGVCGTCARTGQIQLVPDVEHFPGHIACDSRSRSELVLPVKNAEGVVMAVLDLDSPHVEGFSVQEAELLDGLLKRVFSADVKW